MQFEPCFMATAIGSFPQEDSREACRLALEFLSEMPLWPQLPRRSFLENMYAQFTEGLPGIKIDEEKARVWFELGEGWEEELESFYAAVVAGDVERFSMSPRFAAGFEEFVKGEFAERVREKAFAKGQVTGPISFGLTVTDQNRRASLYSETLEEVIVEGLSLKARWQSQALKGAFPNSKVVLFFDEPYLVSVGSALVSVSREKVVGDISKCVERCGADLTGLHCCGSTDWSMVFEIGFDIVHFDAFDYLEGFLAYSKDMISYLEGGGSIVWGIVPNDDRVLEVTAEELVGMVEDGFEVLEERGASKDQLARKSMIGPACGLGPASKEVAERALSLTAEVSTMLRTTYFGGEGGGEVGN